MTTSKFPFLFLLPFFTLVSAQLVERPKINVVPKCGNQLITVDLTIDPETVPGGRFTDWIVVGVTGHPSCRQRGNGELHYMIEIAVFNNPCETQMPSPGVFENRLRIGQNPNVILQGDHNLLIKCIYGLPEVETMPLGSVNPSFRIAQNISASETLSNVSPAELGQQPIGGTQTPPVSVGVLGQGRGPPFGSNGVGNGVPSTTGSLQSSVVSSEFGNPNLNLGQSDDGNSNAVFSANPQGSLPASSTAKATESSQMSLLILLLILLFVLLILCCLLLLFFCLRRRNTRSRNRKKLLVNPLNSAKWVLVISGTLEKRPTKQKEPDSTMNMSESPPKTKATSSATSPSGSSMTATSSVSGNATRGVSVASTALPHGDVAAVNERGVDVDVHPQPKSYSEWRKALLSGSQELGRSRSGSLKVIGKEVAAGEAPTPPSQPVEVIHEDYITSFRSVSEIYQSAETRARHGSHLTIDGGEIYAEATSIPLERLIHCVDRIRGFGARRLTEQELGRWRSLVARDDWFRSQISQADSTDAILQLVDRPEYRNLFTQEKWTQIASCVLQVRPRLRVEHQRDTNLTSTGSASALNVYIGDVGSNW